MRTVWHSLFRADGAIGSLTIRRTSAAIFSINKSRCLQTFAAQAVIAIENARLFHEQRRATDDLRESLEQQTATSEVLEVISSSPGELQPVFDAMLENAMRICWPISAPCIFERETPSEPLRYTTRRLHSSSSGNADHIGPVRVQSLAVC